MSKTEAYVQALVDKAAEKAGNRHALAVLLGIQPSKVYGWHAGTAPISPADRARLAAVAGDDAVQELVRATIEQAPGDRRREQLMQVFSTSSRLTGAVLRTAVLAVFSAICWTAPTPAQAGQQMSRSVDTMYRRVKRS